MKQETEIVKFPGVGDFMEAGGTRWEVLDAQTTSNDDGTQTVHYQIKRVGAELVHFADPKAPLIAMCGARLNAGNQTMLAKNVTCPDCLTQLRVAAIGLR